MGVVHKNKPDVCHHPPIKAAVEVNCRMLSMPFPNRLLLVGSLAVRLDAFSQSICWGCRSTNWQNILYALVVTKFACWIYHRIGVCGHLSSPQDRSQFGVAQVPAGAACRMRLGRKHFGQTAAELGRLHGEDRIGYFRWC